MEKLPKFLPQLDTEKCITTPPCKYLQTGATGLGDCKLFEVDYHE